MGMPVGCASAPGLPSSGREKRSLPPPNSSNPDFRSFNWSSNQSVRPLPVFVNLRDPLSGMIAAPPSFQPRYCVVGRSDVAIAPFHITQIVLVGTFIVIADAVFRHDCPEPLLKTIDYRGPDATRCHTACHDHRIDIFLIEISSHRGLKKYGRAGFANGDVVIGIISPGIELG